MADSLLVAAVRRQVALGRLLPLGRADDGLWIAESAAARVLRHAAETVGGVHVRSLRIGPAGPTGYGRPRVPPPVSALPPGPLRVEAAFDTTGERPLPDTASLVRQALARACAEAVGLGVVTVDLEISGLVEDVPVPGPSGWERPRAGGATAEGAGAAAAAGRAALAVPGVAALDPGPGTGAVSGVSLRDRADPPGHHAEVRLTVLTGHRPLDVALTVRAAVALAVSPAAPGPVTVAVLVTSMASSPS